MKIHTHKADTRIQILPGIKPTLELLAECPERIAKIYCRAGKKGADIDQIVRLCQQNSISLEFIDDAGMVAICKTAPQIAHQGVIATLREIEPPTLDQLLAMTLKAPLPLLIALDQVNDPGNLGTICRTAWCLGCSGILLPKHNSASVGPAAARASAGAIAKLPICTITNLARGLDKAEEAGFSIYGAGISQSNNVNAFEFAWQLPAILVLGNEEHGIRPGVAKRCQNMIAIPLQRQFDSLNVAQAGAILIALCAMKK